MSKKLFEIYDLTTNEILADGLNFDDMPELLGAYENFYPNHEIVVCYRVIHNKKSKHITDRDAFRKEWTDFFGEIIDMEVIL